jgi:tight adherence protein C
VVDGPHHEGDPVTPATLVLVGVAVWALAGTVRRRQLRLVARRRLRPAAAPVGRVPVRARTAVAVAGVVAAVAVSPVVGAVAVSVLATAPLLRRRRAGRDERALAVATLPDAVDLLAVAARARLPAPAAVEAVAERAPPPWGPALAAAARRAARGERFADALHELDGVGADDDLGHALRALLRSAAEDGADLLGGLDRLGVDARDLRRRRAEEAARRVPVRLLLPLVACSLPAFALLTIVPILAGALRALDL